jgi:hypothetical protein
MESFEIPATLPQIANLKHAMNKGRGSLSLTAPNRWRLAGHGVTGILDLDISTGLLTATISDMPFYETIETVKAGILRKMGPPA